MSDETRKMIGELAGVAQEITGLSINSAAQVKVLVLAVAALVKSHPDPAAFAQSFRRFWMQSESPSDCDETTGEYVEGIAAVLEILEAHCAVPLNVRPPDQAAPRER